MRFARMATNTATAARTPRHASSTSVDPALPLPENRMVSSRTAPMSAIELATMTI